MRKNPDPIGHSRGDGPAPWRESVHRSPYHPVLSGNAQVTSIKDASDHAGGANPTRPAEAIFGPLSLLPDQIEAPAFFVDNNLCIRWVATGGADAFSTALVRELRSTASRNAFNLLLRPSIKHAISDWRSFFSFVYTTLRNASVTTSDIDSAFSSITRASISPSSREPINQPEHRAFMVDSCPLGTDDPAYRVFSMVFDKGTLFVLRHDGWPQKVPFPVMETPVSRPVHSVAEKKTIGVLSAQLNDSRHLSKSMLPDFFLTLINRIWDEADGVARSLGGKRAACNGPRLCYVFSENAGRNPVFSAICCATRLNDQMELLEEKLQAQYGWANEICLNMGIGHGAGDRAGSDGIGSLEFVIPGGAFDQATLLAGIAGKGEIWITQQSAAQLPKNMIDQVVLGVDRDGKFLRHFFKRVSDIQPLRAIHQTDADMQALSIAQVKGLERR